MNLLLATSVCASFGYPGDGAMDHHRFWHRSLLCACVTRLLARRCAVLDGEAAYVRGLLHDIGHMVMWQRMPEETALARGRAKQHELPVSVVQREMFGFDYAAVGALLLQRWHMPVELVEVVRHHVEPAAAGACVVDAALVHIASHVAEVLVDGIDTVTGDGPDAAVWCLAGAQPDWLPGICAKAQPQAADAMSVLFGGSRRSA